MDRRLIHWFGTVVSVGVFAMPALGAGCVVYTHERPASGKQHPPPGSHPGNPGGPHGPPPGARPPPPPTGPAGAPLGPGAALAAPGSPPLGPSAGGPDGQGDATDLPPPGSPVPAQPPFDELTDPTDRAEVLPPGVGRGRPPSFRPGAPAGYWIWQGPRGSWLLRTTAGGLAHLFRGRVAATSSEIVNVHPLRTEFRDRIRRSSGSWSFSFLTDGHADGFTFMTRDGGCVRFALDLEAGPQQKRVFVGHGEVQPRTGHFIVCPTGKKPPG